MKKLLLLLAIPVALNNYFQAQNWQLLIPSTSYDGSKLGLSSSAFDRNNGKIYSLYKNQLGNKFYEFNINANSVAEISNQNGPNELYVFTFDPIHSKIIAVRSGTDMVYSISSSGGFWSNQGSGSYDAYHYGANLYFNQLNNSIGFLGGYGVYMANNAVWENDGTQWTEILPNNSNCDNATPPRRVGFNATLGNPNGTEVFFSSSQGNCSGNQMEQSCALGTGWASDIGVWCWLKDLWKYDYQANLFTQILPPNHSSYVEEGDLTYDYVNNIFYLLGGSVPSPVYNPGYNPNFSSNVLRYRVGIDNGFVPMNVGGIAPSVTAVSNMGAHNAYFDANQNRIIWIRFDGVYSINLSGAGLEEESSRTLTIAPNPSNSECTITVNSNLIGERFIISDASGKIVLDSKIASESTTINVAKFSKGFYTITIDGMVPQRQALIIN
jgi:hypothetical protein